MSQEIEFYLPNGATYLEPLDGLSVQRYFNAGASITTKIFQKNISSIDEFSALQKEKEHDFEVFARKFANNYRMGVEVGKCKTEQRLETKILDHQGFFNVSDNSLDDEKQKAICTIHDGLRARFYTTGRRQLANVVNRLSASTNKNILDIQDGFMTVNKENGMPRFKVIYDFQGFNVELQIYDKRMEDAFLLTGVDYKRQRALDAAVQTSPAAMEDVGLLMSLDKRAKQYRKHRLDIHEEYRCKLKLDRFEVSAKQREFFYDKKKGFFFTAPDPYGVDSPNSALCPDYERGVYVVDNGMTDDATNVTKISQDEFVSSVVTEYRNRCFNL
jgi:hypothetical protein